MLFRSGRDDFGKNILDRLKKDGVNCDYVLESDKGTTGVAFVTYFADGERKFIFHMDHTPAVMAKAPNVKEDNKNFDDTKFFHIMGCSLTANAEFGAEIIKVMEELQGRGVKVSFDPNIRPELLKDENSFNYVKKAFEASNIFRSEERRVGKEC